MNQSRPEQSSRYQALLRLLRTADTIWNASREFFAPWNLSPSQFNVLNLLRDVPEGRTQIELGRLLLTHRSNVTGLVDRLEERGWVQRLDDEQDRRAFRVVLTSAGQKLLGEILPHYHSAAERALGCLSPQRATELVKELDQVSANVEAEAARRRDSPATKS